MIKKIAILVVLLKIITTVTKADTKPQYDNTEIIIPAADTIRLATDIYLPKTDGPFACILIRTPYNKDGAKGEAEKFVQEGLAVVAQDTRGTGKSNCRFYAFAHEREDGLATLAWIRSQKWSNGRVGGWGGSYVGYTQWAIADQLDAVTALLTTADMYDAFYPSGIFSLATSLNWGLIMNQRKIKPEKILAGYSMLPLSIVDDSTGAANAFLDDWLNHPENDSYWQSITSRRPLAKPVLSIAGWYDIFLESQIKDFVALGAKRHSDSHLIIGPFAHGQITIPTDYGDAAKLDQYMKLVRSFLTQQVKNPGVLPTYADSLMNKPFAFFIIHRNQWVFSDKWPPEQSRPVKYYLAPKGRLSLQKPLEKEQVGYSYNPLDPHPSLGGTFLGIGVGPAWQNANTNRKDQAVFESDSLTAALTLLGPLQSEIYVNSDALCTDFYVCLQDMQPDGQIVNIQEGGKILRSKKTKAVHKLQISLWPAGYQLGVGHKLRLVICSSLFPRYNRNLNNNEPIFSAHTIKTGQQKIFFGPKQPSHLILSVMP